MLIRAARPEDLEDIYRLVTYYANQGALLPRTRESLTAHLPHLTVAYQNNQLAGVVALHRLEPTVSEVRSLAVDPAFHKQGIGQKLVLYAVHQAEEEGYHKVIAFTRQVIFFEHCGFHAVPRESVPGKYFIDCVGCPMLTHCDEIAMERVLTVDAVRTSLTTTPASLT
ncbi:GNAT family N-acetyltransferase [Sulfobacillus thermosulfidooxidans]|uniref:GNAT family N-acetyltransferase n=1 Tax=Sulfobacillus thermosulfidooxidans TaxID=28034 RepID=UPI0006B6429C|nr:GNAT family N-acetyltransferase [Sulfobacillus thermosulfidooxidans]